jgi:amino-acid N-acetyltransferase
MNDSAIDGSQQAAVRRAAERDVPAIGALMERYAALGNVLPRTADDIQRNLNEFYVVEQQSRVVGCGALEIFTPELAEIRSLMIAEDHAGRGLGGRLVEYLVAEARDRGHKRLMALTYVPQFFHKFGFETVSKHVLPEKVWGICVACYKLNDCDETAVLKHL